MAEGALVLIFLLVAAGAPLVLYLFIRAETEDLPVMDREAAERAARRDTEDDPRDRRSR